jgi:hypothetical protein
MMSVTDRESRKQFIIIEYDCACSDTIVRIKWVFRTMSM